MVICCESLSVSEGFIAKYRRPRWQSIITRCGTKTTSTIEVPKYYLQNPFDVLVVDENGNKKRPLTSLKEYPSHSLIELDLYGTNGTLSLLYDLFQAEIFLSVRGNLLSRRGAAACWTGGGGGQFNYPPCVFAMLTAFCAGRIPQRISGDWSPL